MSTLGPSPVGWLVIPLSLVVVFLVLALTIVYFRSCYSYWSSRGIGSPDPIWGLGNLYPRLRPTMSLAEFDQWLYRDCGGSRFCGFYEFTQPVLMVGDPELLKHVMIRDFDHFCDRSFVTFNDPVMDHMLLGLKGSVWKRVRSVMTPTFSSGKVKQTLGLVSDCAANLITYFINKLDLNVSVFEMKDVYGMFTMDTIASIAFGVSSDSLNNTQDEFSAAAARFFAEPQPWQKPLLWLQWCAPQLTRSLGLGSLSRTPIHFFSKVVSDTINYRLKHQLRRNDFLQLLLDASLQEKTNNNDKNNTKNKTSSQHKDGEGNTSNGKAKQGGRQPRVKLVDGQQTRPSCEEDADSGPAPEGQRKSCNAADKASEAAEPVLTEEVITAQCVLFYMAGYDTTATTLSFVSYCLALHPAVQQKLMEEGERVLAAHDNVLTYDALQEMPYLDMVFSETLRLFPPAPRVDRRCTKEYTIPGTHITIAPDTKITIPIYSIHRDARYFPDPDRFDPERFSGEGRSRPSPAVYMPFGSGPRNCIGKRFALMEAKLVMVLLLQEFALLPCRRTQVPIALDKSSGLLKAEQGVWLRLAKRVAE
ncbi:Cytochrome P450 [Trinorchestia longiramus]|nr:Cytochrome P450 [Trinorchestia longiramus]